MPRDYDRVLAALPDPARLSTMSRVERMQAVVDALWDAFHAQGVSWVGFYTPTDDGESMILGPRRDKPACSPLGLHGACGTAFSTGRELIVRDVRDLGPNYIACDPKDRSEIVLPVFDRSGRPWAVLDVDSRDLASFDESDALGLRRVLERAGLT